MPDLDPEFINDVKTLSQNGTLIEVLRRVKAQCVAGWEAAINTDERERAWYLLKAIDSLNAEITSLTTDQKVRDFNNKIRRVS